MAFQFHTTTNLPTTEGAPYQPPFTPSSAATPAAPAAPAGTAPITVTDAHAAWRARRLKMPAAYVESMKTAGTPGVFQAGGDNLPITPASAPAAPTSTPTPAAP